MPNLHGAPRQRRGHCRRLLLLSTALACKDNETVDRAYKKAIELGAKDEGEPGNRMPTFYGAYFRDPDGNKICVCKLG